MNSGSEFQAAFPLLRHHSAEDAHPTCFIPFWDRAFEGLWTVVKPVSSWVSLFSRKTVNLCTNNNDIVKKISNSFITVVLYKVLSSLASLKTHLQPILWANFCFISISFKILNNSLLHQFSYLYSMRINHAFYWDWKLPVYITVYSKPAFLKLWSADHKWSLRSALVVLQKRHKKK
jgi:hypothetical protein